MTASSAAPILELIRIQKRYGQVPALSGLDLRLERGEVYGFLGRNGAGKSTTLRIVMGITRADHGEVRLFGAASGAGDIRPRQRIGYVAQEQHFYDWMTPARLGAFVGAFYPTWDGARFQQLLRQLDVPDRKVRTLSGGTKVKLALALALAHRPELLVLDEPTAGLDPVARREFLEIVRELNVDREHATLFSSHLVDEVEQVATRVGIVEGGTMRYEGSPSELTSNARLVVLSSQHLQHLASLFPGHDALATATIAISSLPLQLLQARFSGDALEVTLWSQAPASLLALEALLPGIRHQPLSLEDAFIALVRTRAAADLQALAARQARQARP